jgi:hypothetical protein
MATRPRPHAHQEATLASLTSAWETAKGEAEMKCPTCHRFVDPERPGKVQQQQTTVGDTIRYVSLPMQ